MNASGHQLSNGRIMSEQKWHKILPPPLGSSITRTSFHFDNTKLTNEMLINKKQKERAHDYVKRDGLKKVFIVSTGQKVIVCVQLCKKEHPKKEEPFRNFKARSSQHCPPLLAIETKENVRVADTQKLCRRNVV